MNDLSRNRTRNPPMAVFRPLPFAAALLVLTSPLLSGTDPAKKEKETKEPDEVSYYLKIRPIFQQHCQGCHQPARPKGGFIMTGHADLFKKGEHEGPGIV